MKQYDYLVVGAGLWGSVFAHEATKRGKKCLVIDRRDHIGGNVYCENVEGINVHKYGAHIFHTNDKDIWDYVNSFVEFNRYTNSPVANYNGELYNLPFNMNTFYQLWRVRTPEEAKEKIRSHNQKPPLCSLPAFTTQRCVPLPSWFRSMLPSEAKLPSLVRQHQRV